MNKPLKIFKTIADFKAYINPLWNDNQVGFVPTMGYLHKGHGKLMSRSMKENDLTIVSIFINPTQFNNLEDLTSYPKDWNIAIAEQAKVDAVFAPSAEEMYPDNFSIKLTESNLSKMLCGKYRPGHFDGVLSIVMKLFLIVQPQRAYFGEKDYQQFALINQLAKAFHIPTKIIACPTVRESNGLALSSRNSLLSNEGREQASLLFKAISEYQTVEAAKRFLLSHDINIEYIEEYDNRLYVAAFVEGIRLIDNVPIRK